MTDNDKAPDEIGRLWTLMARALATYDAMQAAPLTGPDAPFTEFHAAIEEMRDALRKEQRRGTQRLTP